LKELPGSFGADEDAGCPVGDGEDEGDVVSGGELKFDRPARQYPKVRRGPQEQGKFSPFRDQRSRLPADPPGFFSEVSPWIEDYVCVDPSLKGLEASHEKDLGKQIVGDIRDEAIGETGPSR
jgi:hypothetical protein